MEERLKPAQFSIFKGKSALRLKVLRQTADFEPGCLFLELAPFKSKNENGNRIYDWENKISIKLEIVDLAKIGYAFERGISAELFHEYNGNVKTISVSRVEGQSPYFITVNQKLSSGEKSSISVPCSAEEVYSLLCLVRFAIPATLGW